jgi:hypothetical protein
MNNGRPGAGRGAGPSLFIEEDYLLRGEPNVVPRVKVIVS